MYAKTFILENIMSQNTQSQGNAQSQLRLFDIAEAPIKQWLVSYYKWLYPNKTVTVSEFFNEPEGQRDEVFFEAEGSGWSAGVEVDLASKSSRIDVEYWKQRNAPAELRASYFTYMRNLAQNQEIKPNDVASKDLYEATTEFKFQSTINLLFASVGTVFPHVKKAAISVLDEKDPYVEFLKTAKIRVNPQYNYFEFCEIEKTTESENMSPVLYFYLRPKEDISILQKLKRLNDFGTPFEDIEDADDN